jgi:Protein of unknown function (DUF4244)
MRALFVWKKSSGRSSATPALAAAAPPASTPSATAPPSRRFGLARLRRAGRDAGMTTAEYAVGTVAACGFGGVLYKVLTSDAVLRLLSDILRRALTVSF